MISIKERGIVDQKSLKIKTFMRRFSMLKNKVKEMLKNGESTLGLVCNLISPQLTEIFGLTGFDFDIFDMEHGAYSFETLEKLVRVAKLYDMVPMARVPENSPKTILRALDAGCLGIVVPQIESKEEAQRFIDSTKYPPKGIRGTNWKTAAGQWGNYNASEYMAAADKNILRIIQIETKTGLDNIEEIVSVEDIDVVLIGASDLSASMGYPGNPGAPEVQEAIDHIIDTSKKAGIVIGGGGGTDKEKMADSQKRGVRMYFANPAVFIRKNSQEIASSIKETFIY